MLLTELEKWNIPKKKIDQLQKAGLETVSDLFAYYPRKYTDRSNFTGIRDTGESIFIFTAKSVFRHNSRTQHVEAIGSVEGNPIEVRILWHNQAYMRDIVAASIGKPVLVAGMANYEPADPYYQRPARITVTNPAIYDAAGAAALGIYPSYKKIPGMAEAYLWNILRLAKANTPPLEETVPSQLLQKHGLISHDEMIHALHFPKTAAQLTQAITRKRFDDLLYFAMRIEIGNRAVPNGSVYNLPKLNVMNQVKDSLPFTLTKDQAQALDDMIQYIRTGKRLNALVQGDVGCGKTILAQLLMIAFASNGYQAVMMAPTTILAKQHYENMAKLCQGLNISIRFIGGGKLRVKEQRELQDSLASGKIQLIIGTQALLSQNYQFKNLALVIEDEEHKYGVLQRAALTEKAAGGAHTVTMSATPIPRSLAQTIYGDSLQLFSITQKPSGRKPVATGIAPNAGKAISFIRRHCGPGKAQAYVVCPMITASNKQSMEGVAAAEDVFKQYKAALSDVNIPVALITGKTAKTEADQILQDFAAGNISVLVATSIIEVGINVPAANCIIIHNAERFGLAQLHQLRGRVGRGNAKAFCCLISVDQDNPRLNAMVQYTDGFQIAQMDLQQRGAGDFLGVQQSGTEKFLALALQYPQEYQLAQAAAKELLDSSCSCILREKAEADHADQKGGEILFER